MPKPRMNPQHLTLSPYQWRSSGPSASFKEDKPYPLEQPRSFLFLFSLLFVFAPYL
jgi:hypothetical protein